MIIEVTGVSTRNKGAELLLVAIREHFLKTNPSVQLAVTPAFGSYDERVQYGLRHVVRIEKLGRARLGTALLPGMFTRQLGMVREGDIDAVLDASGFAFSDQLPLKRTLEFARDVERWKKQGKKIVMLPQALGPFEAPAMKDGFKRIVDAVDLIYARESESYNHAIRTAGSSEKIRLAPDITVQVEGEKSPTESVNSKKPVLIVPNFRMLDKVSPDQAQAYIPFVGRCIEVVRKRGLDVKILLHDNAEDNRLVVPLQQYVGQIQVLTDENPLRLKAMLGEAQLVIGSRFHALLGALSQGVPVIAAGWSHKYEMLLCDFDCPEMILNPAATEKIVGEKLDLVNLHSERIAVGLDRSRSQMKAKLNHMWNDIEMVLGIEQVERTATIHDLSL